MAPDSLICAGRGALIANLSDPSRVAVAELTAGVAAPTADAARAEDGAVVVPTRENADCHVVSYHVIGIA
jgi:hypothetical protein